jgi:hypothetical protein
MAASGALSPCCPNCCEVLRVSDLDLAMLIMMGLSAVLALLGLSIGRSGRKWALLAMLLTIGFMLAFPFVLQDKLFLVRLLPFSSLIILANLQPLAVGLVAGLAWHIIPGPPARRWMVLVPLLLVGGYAVYMPLRGHQLPIRDMWYDGVCVQTTDASCSAAAAATLLMVHGIPARESEMAKLCLTRDRGTTIHGLYRGLKLKTAGTGWDVAVSTTSDIERLKQLNGRPAIITVGLAAGRGGSAEYRDWGWQPGVYHTVVLFGFHPNGRADIGDPAVGRESWSPEALADLYRGEALYLIER